MDKYVCDICGYVYDPAEGDPDNGVAPGTAFEEPAVLHQYKPLFRKKWHGIGKADDFVHIHALSLIIIIIHGVAVRDGIL